MNIPKIIHQCWVGEKPVPEHWTKTWKEKNPKWKYMLWDNETVKQLDIQCKKQFDYYLERKEYPGVADIVRYHALYQYGGFQPGADSTCLNPIDDIFKENFELMTIACYDKNKEDWGRIDGEEEDGQTIHFLDVKNKEFNGLVAPIHASIKGHWFLKALIEEIAKIDNPGKPWQTTGNALCEKMIKKYKPDIKILPMYTFFPFRVARTKPPRNYQYIGKEKVYSHHFLGTTTNAYEE